MVQILFIMDHASSAGFGPSTISSSIPHRQNWDPLGTLNWYRGSLNNLSLFVLLSPVVPAPHANSVTITHPQRQSSDFLPKPLTCLFLAALHEHCYQLGHHKNSENQSRAGRYTLRNSEFTLLILGTSTTRNAGPWCIWMNYRTKSSP